jgi:hypothetical protein
LKRKCGFKRAMSGLKAAAISLEGAIMKRMSLFGVLLTLAGVSYGAPDSLSMRLDTVESRMEAILNKAGISFSGDFRSQYFHSKASGNVVDSTKRLTETNEFTSVDFDIKARPNDAIGGRLIFRMHQNWQNFFSDISNPIFTRWISIDGSLENIVSWHLGDFKAKYTPLTL